MNEEKILCPFCSAPYTKEMLEAYNGSYGCESECSYYRIVIKCASCEKTVYVKGDFGDADKKEAEEEYGSDDMRENVALKNEYSD